MVPIPTAPSTAKLSTAVTAVSIVVVVPFTVRLPLNVALVPVTVPTVMFGVPVSPCAFVATVAVFANVAVLAVPVTLPVRPLGKSGAPVPALSPVSYTHLTLPTILLV